MSPTQFSLAAESPLTHVELQQLEKEQLEGLRSTGTLWVTLHDRNRDVWRTSGCNDCGIRRSFSCPLPALLFCQLFICEGHPATVRRISLQQSVRCQNNLWNGGVQKPQMLLLIKQKIFLKKRKSFRGLENCCIFRKTRKSDSLGANIKRCGQRGSTHKIPGNYNNRIRIQGTNINWKDNNQETESDFRVHKMSHLDFIIIIINYDYIVFSQNPKTCDIF